MPADLRAHIRYPQDLFAIQARMYATYHMQDPQVFYNKEDLWTIPRRMADGREREMEPYYTIMRLPGEKTEEFILLLPVQPQQEGQHDRLAGGPLRRRRTTASSSPTTSPRRSWSTARARSRPASTRTRSSRSSSRLWSQRGSQVIRGSLLAIPIEQSLLYVQPLYLAAEKGSLPELKRVIVSMGNQIAMEETLEASLAQLFGGGKLQPVARAGTTHGSRGRRGIPM